MQASNLLLFFGELLWDMLPSGAQPGGAPANVAVNAHHCGAQTLLASAVGADDAGKRMLTLLDARKLRLDAIQIVPDKPTGSVQVTLDAQDTPTYHIAQNVAWDAIAPTDTLLAAIRHARVLYFGSLAQRAAISRQTLRQLLTLAPAGCLRFFDINLRKPYPTADILRFSVAHTDVLKLNEDELPQLAQTLGLPTDQAGFAAALYANSPVRAILLTRGAKGTTLFEKGKAVDGTQIDAAPVQVLVNTVGAGDAFCAGLLAAVASGASLQQAAHAGSTLASQVCQNAGAWL